MVSTLVWAKGAITTHKGGLYGGRRTAARAAAARAAAARAAAARAAAAKPRTEAGARTSRDPASAEHAGTQLATADKRDRGATGIGRPRVGGDTEDAATAAATAVGILQGSRATRLDAQAVSREPPG